MIGGLLVEELLNDNDYDRVRILTRRPVKLTHQKLEKKIVDFEDSDSLLIALSDSDAIFSAIGTTKSKTKGDRAAYWKIDHDIPVRVARLGKLVGCESFAIVTAVGANPSSSNSYLKLKGEVEKDIRAIGINSVHVMRPSMIMGDRNESRPMEKVFQKIFSVASFLIPSKYKGIQGSSIARAMIKAVKENKQGFNIYHYSDMMKLADQ